MPRIGECSFSAIVYLWRRALQISTQQSGAVEMHATPMKKRQSAAEHASVHARTARSAGARISVLWARARMPCVRAMRRVLPLIGRLTEVDEGGAREDREDERDQVVADEGGGAVLGEDDADEGVVHLKGHRNSGQRGRRRRRAVQPLRRRVAELARGTIEKGTGMAA